MKTLMISIPFFLGASLSQAKTPAIEQLTEWLALPKIERNLITDNKFSNMPISKSEAEEAQVIIWQDHVSLIKSQRLNEMKNKRIKIGDKTLKFDFLIYGEKPKSGRSLYISMHGGGGAPPHVNDGQWKNQMRLYKPKEGIYLCPRAPTDTWNLWHQSHIDPLFDRLIENMIIFEDVDPDKVYLMGYSAGGDGVYQLAPRMCDRFAAAAMMAGHPNETSPQGLRNLPFALQVGENDKSYRRNKIAESWGEKLAELKESDPQGYPHFVKIHKNKGHWMNLEDNIAVPWMAKYKRNRFPDRIVWKQDDVTHKRSYWISLPDEQIKTRDLIIVSKKDQSVDIQDRGQANQIDIMLNDEMIDFDKPVTVSHKGKVVFERKPRRSITEIYSTLKERGDPGLVFSSRLRVKLD